MELSSLVGEILTNIDVSDDTVMLTTKSGRQITLFHSQTCCESVRILSTDGEWRELIGKPLMIVEAEIDGSNETERGSETETTFTFGVDGATVINRWIGESNGYYSELVRIEEITSSSAGAI